MPLKPFYKTEKHLVLKLTFWQYVTHYTVCVLPLLVFGLTLYKLAEFYIFDTYTGVIKPKEMWVTLGITFALFLIILSWQRNRLKFIEHSIKVEPDVFLEAVERTAKTLEWHVISVNEEWVQAKRNGFWSGSWGELITIQRDENRLRINSICDPDRRASITSYGWNKKNVKALLQNIQEVNQGIPYHPEKEEPEWTLKNTFARIIKYAFSIFFISLFFILFSELEMASKILFGFIALLSSAYLILDIVVLIKKRTQKNTYWQ